MKGLKAIIFIFTWSVSFLYADTENLNQLLQSFQSMSANFTQTVIDSKGVNTVVTGSVLIKKPKQFRWDVQAPNQQLFISNGSQLWNVEPDLEQATVSPLSENLSTTPLLLLSGNVEDIQQLFQVTTLADERYVLIPKNQDALIKKVILVFKENSISSITIVNTMGQTAVVNFTEVKLNQTIPVTMFTYKPAEGMQVLQSS